MVVVVVFFKIQLVEMLGIFLPNVGQVSFSWVISITNIWVYFAHYWAKYAQHFNKLSNQPLGRSPVYTCLVKLVNFNQVG